MLNPYNPRKVPIFDRKSLLIVPYMVLYNRDIRKLFVNYWGCMNIVQLMSGFDSVAQALILQAQGHTIFPLYVHFRKGGGKVAKEEASMREVIRAVGFQSLEVVHYRIPKEQYDTRNQKLCTLAANHALMHSISHIAIGSHLFEDADLYGNFPRADADPNVLQAAVPSDITVIPGQLRKSVALHNLCNKNRKILFKTTSCQMWYKDECGKCFSCIERHAAFVLVMGYDHTTYTFDPKVSTRWFKYLKTEQIALALHLQGQESE